MSTLTDDEITGICSRAEGFSEWRHLPRGVFTGCLHRFQVWNRDTKAWSLYDPLLDPAQCMLLEDRLCEKADVEYSDGVMRVWIGPSTTPAFKFHFGTDPALRRAGGAEGGGLRDAGIR